MKRFFAFFTVLVAAAIAPAVAQQGAARVTGGAPVQPSARPVLAPQLPPAATPTARGPMPTPLPGGPMASAPVDLKAEAIERIAPLTAQEVIQLRQELDARATAMQQPLTQVGKPVRRVVSLDLSPGAAPEVFRAAFGQGGVVTFMDAAGRPWPVLELENYNPSGLDVSVLGSNGVSIGVKSSSTRIGNIAVRLEGLSSPVTFAVAIGQEEIDYSLEMQLARYLPGAPAPVGAVEGLPSLAAPDMMNYLLGTPPTSARQLTSNNSVVRAWQISPQTMVVRTEAMLASPRYSRRQSSANGMTVYELPISPKLILASQGQMQSVSLMGFEGTKERI